MVCLACRNAADTGLPKRHERCESPASCSCQHHPRGTGIPEAPQPPAAEPVVTQIGLKLDEARQAALDSTGLSFEGLRAKISNWEADTHELRVWRILEGEAA